MILLFPQCCLLLTLLLFLVTAVACIQTVAGILAIAGVPADAITVVG